MSRWLSFDADLALSHARFRDSDPAGNYVPNGDDSNLGATVDALGPWFGALRFRYFRPRPLIEDNAVRSKASAITNLRVGYRMDRQTSLALDVFQSVRPQDQ